ncbi:hypothetical protein [Thermoanaerobacterium sp. RBIITD]|uniref:hypothetical protein n=1 Tax=Thermoanaerobacterium sp. RBIITD TaxID=1550240 RepID=UPI000BB7222A|nr:hypothetical protein [Thermoanaerobacterium sp. RBIITD]SNX52843.1 hypothetical protein SAMN05660242_0295 [Thermoanaerobacterium sp. RBIITD]
MNNSYRLKKLDINSLKEIFKFDFDGEFTLKNNLNKETLINLGLIDCIIYNYDSVLSDKISNVDIDYDNLIEARFFNSSAEIRLFTDDDKLKGTIFIEEDSVGKNEYIESVFILYPRYGEKEVYAEKLRVRKYISYDDDNQAYISYVKPCELIFKE